MRMWLDDLGRINIEWSDNLSRGEAGDTASIPIQRLNGNIEWKQNKTK